MGRSVPWSRRLHTCAVVDSYAEMEPLLTEGRIEEARELIINKYRVGPSSCFRRSRSVMSYWLDKMGNLQFRYYAERRQKTKSFFEAQKTYALYQSLGDLVKQYVLELGRVEYDLSNRTLLHDAAYFQLTGICEFLLAQGYDPNAQAKGYSTSASEALDGFRFLPLGFDAEFDPFRVKALFSTLLDAGADPDVPTGTGSSASARLNRMSKWFNVLKDEDDATKAKWNIPDLEGKIPLMRRYYVDVLNAYRQRKLRGV